jgi:predicted nucleotidyltransferase
MTPRRSPSYSFAMATSDTKLQNIVQVLKDEFRPKRVLLFGSRARGDHRSNSDYDLILVGCTTTSLSKIEKMQRASDLLYPLGVTADVFFYSEEEFDAWKDEFSSIPEVALREGQELDLG